MSNRAGLEAFRRTVTVDWPKSQAVDAKKLLLEVSSDDHDQIMQQQSARSGIAPDWDAYANRPGNRDLQSVVLPGPIVYTYDYRREVAIVMREALRRASPVDSGEYADSHMFYLDGVPADDLPPDLTPISEIMIANTTPYSRRLEVGVTKSGRPFVIQVDPHIYERVLGQVRPQFREVAKMTFDYATLPGAWTITGGLGRRTPRYTTGKTPGVRGGGILRKRALHTGEKVRAPAIVIEALE